MSSSLVFPIFSGISLITTAIAGYVFFKEKLNKQAYLAIIIGVVALVFLNL
jgi:multidrug transporter EmrE-like cation transporter